MFVRSVNLSEMCLNVIIHNLESIIFNDNIPEKNTNFLLRVYSEKVFKEYRKIKGITRAKEDIMLWFLNPHVKSVTIPGRLCTEKVINRLQIVGTEITSLNLHKSAASESELGTIISCIPNVKILDLSSTSCTDSTLSVIQKTCPVIEELNLHKCQKVTDDGMKNLCGKNQSLKSLDLEDSKVKDLGVCTVLRGMPFLECLKYYDLSDLLLDISNDHQKYGFTELKFNLTELIYHEIKSRASRKNADPLKIIEAWTKLCPKIKKVNFHCPVEKEVLQACTGFQELEELKIKGCYAEFRYSDVRIYNFLAPVVPIALNLKTLILSCLEIDSLMLLNEFKNLENLYMRSVSFTVFNPASITCTESKLNVLVIKSTNMRAQAIIYLMSLSRNVTKLHIDYYRGLQSGLLSTISCSMNKLSSVYLRYRNVEFHSLMPFFDIPSLKKIHIADGFYGIGNFLDKRLSLKSSSTLFWRYMDEDEVSTNKTFKYDKISLPSFHMDGDSEVEIDSEDSKEENDEICFKNDVSMISDDEPDRYSVSDGVISSDGDYLEMIPPYSTDDSMSDSVMSDEYNDDSDNDDEEFFIHYH